MKKILGVVLFGVCVLLVGCDKAAQEVQAKPAKHLADIAPINGNQTLNSAEKKSTVQEVQVKPAKHLADITSINTHSKK